MHPTRTQSSPCLAQFPPPGDARRQIDLYDSRSFDLALSPEERVYLATLVNPFPPVIDHFLIKSQAEVSAIINLRVRLEDLASECTWASLNINDSRHLLQALRARKFNIDKAEVLWRQSHAWRQENGMNIMSFILPEVMDRYGTGGQFGLDREGSPVVVNNIGMVDQLSIMRHVSTADLLESELFKLERLQALCDVLSVRTGRLQSQITLIIDLKGFNSRHLARQGLLVTRAVMETTQTLYFERAKRILIINAPTLFAICWRFLSLFLAEDTKEKTQIFSNTPLPLLARYIAPDQLPREYGGTASSMFPAIRPGGPVPADFKPEFEDTDTGDD